MITQIETRVISVTVVPVGEPIFSEMASSVRIEDEAMNVKTQGQADGEAVCPAEVPCWALEAT